MILAYKFSHSSKHAIVKLLQMWCTKFVFLLFECKTISVSKLSRFCSSTINCLSQLSLYAYASLNALLSNVIDSALFMVHILFHITALYGRMRVNNQALMRHKFYQCKFHHLNRFLSHLLTIQILTHSFFRLHLKAFHLP